MLFGNLLSAQIDFSKDPLPSSFLNEMDKRIQAGDYEQLTSVVIAIDGKVFFEKYYNGANENTLHNTRSATKSFAALLVGMAIDKGHIASEKEPIIRFLQHKLPEENKDPRKDLITIEDLLTMSSILECDDNNQFSRGNEERMYLIEDWSRFFVDLPVKAYSYGPKPEQQPYGRSMSYCSAGAAILAEIVQSAINSKVHLFAEKELLEPLEITDYKLHFTPMDILNTAGGSEYRSRDFLKLIQLCLQEGRWKDRQLVSATWIKKATSPKVNAWEGMDYGYLFWLKNFGSGEGVPSFAMAGNGGNKIIAFPSLKAAIVLTATNYNNRKAHQYTDEILSKYIVPALQETDRSTTMKTH